MALDIWSDNIPVSYDEATTYSENDKVSTATGYYVSRVDNNLGFEPESYPELWAFAHGIDPVEYRVDKGAFDGMATYDWGDLVTDSDKKYLSRIYQNTNDVSDVDSWYELRDREENLTCGNEYLGTWKPGTYKLDQVVDLDGTKYSCMVPETNSVPGDVPQTIWKVCTYPGSPPALPDIQTPTRMLFPNVKTVVGESYVSNGVRAEALVETVGADINDRRYFQPSQTNGNYTLSEITLGEYSGLTPANIELGEVVTHEDAYYVREKTGNDTDAPDLPGSDYAFIQPNESASLTARSEPASTGETITFHKKGFYVGVEDWYTQLFMRLGKHVYGVKNDYSIEQFGRGDYQKFFGTNQNFVISFYIPFKRLTKTLDYIRINADTNSERFDTIKFVTNFVSEQTVNAADTDRYDLEEGYHQLKSREVDAAQRVRGRYVKVTITKNGKDSAPQVIVESVLSLSRVSH